MSRVRPLDTRWRNLLAKFMRLALIRELAWMRYSSGPEADGTAFTPEHEANLRLAIKHGRD